jgi:hypothetical protein
MAARVVPVLGLALLGAAAGLGFAMWMDHGDRIFMALAENGLAWCF